MGIIIISGRIKNSLCCIYEILFVYFNEFLFLWVKYIFKVNKNVQSIISSKEFLHMFENVLQSSIMSFSYFWPMKSPQFPPELACCASPLVINSTHTPSFPK